MEKKLIFIIFILINLSNLCLIDRTSSRYMSEMNSKNDINVAIPRIEIKNIKNSDEKVLPGSTKIVEFDVCNYNTKTNEVLMEYYINIDGIEYATVPLEYEIYEVYDGGYEMKMLKTDKGYGPTALNYGFQETKHFKLVLSWDITEEDVSYADKEFLFNISIDAEQII